MRLGEFAAQSIYHFLRIRHKVLSIARIYKMSARHVPRSILDTLSRSSPSKYICRQCRRTLRPQPEVSQQQRYASTALSNNERSRQRATVRRHNVALPSQDGPAQRTVSSVAQPDMDDFDEPVDTNARTWEGLPTIGHNGDWRDMPEMVQDDYMSYVFTLRPCPRPRWL